MLTLQMKHRLKLALMLAAMVLSILPIVVTAEAADSAIQSLHARSWLWILRDALAWYFNQSGFIFCFMAATGILAFFLWSMVSASTAKTHLLYPLVLPLIIAAWFAAQSLPFFRVPTGEWIRPMVWSRLMCLSLPVLMLLSFGVTINEFLKQRKILPCALALLLTLSIVLVPFLSLALVSRIKGFELSD